MKFSGVFIVGLIIFVSLLIGLTIGIKYYEKKNNDSKIEVLWYLSKIDMMFVGLLTFMSIVVEI